MHPKVQLDVQEEEVPVTMKRGWRFYGTFGTLALVNFICAIDATILSVALPVIACPDVHHTELTTIQDDIYGSEGNNHHPGLLDRDILSLVC